MTAEAEATGNRRESSSEGRRHLPGVQRSLDGERSALRPGTPGGECKMPLLDVFFTMMWFFLWVLWFFLLFRVIMDIFRSRDLGGWGKAGWLVFTIVLPFLGVLVYLIARGDTMADREASAKAQAAFHVREAAPGQRYRRRAHEAGRPARPRGHQRRRLRAGQGKGPAPAGCLTRPTGRTPAGRRRWAIFASQRAAYRKARTVASPGQVPRSPWDIGQNGARQSRLPGGGS